MTASEQVVSLREQTELLDKMREAKRRRAVLEEIRSRAAQPYARHNKVTYRRRQAKARTAHALVDVSLSVASQAVTVPEQNTLPSVQVVPATMPVVRRCGDCGDPIHRQYIETEGTFNTRNKCLRCTGAVRPEHQSKSIASMDMMGANLKLSEVALLAGVKIDVVRSRLERGLDPFSKGVVFK